MNYQKKYRQNNDLIRRYADYIPYCTTLEQRIKLSCEIAKLQQEIDLIEKMEYAQTLQKIDFFEIKVHSNL